MDNHPLACPCCNKPLELPPWNLIVYDHTDGWSGKMRFRCTFCNALYLAEFGDKIAVVPGATYAPNPGLRFWGALI